MTYIGNPRIVAAAFIVCLAGMWSDNSFADNVMAICKENGGRGEFEGENRRITYQERPHLSVKTGGGRKIVYVPDNFKPDIDFADLEITRLHGPKAKKALTSREARPKETLEEPCMSGAQYDKMDQKLRQQVVSEGEYALNEENLKEAHEALKGFDARKEGLLPYFFLNHLDELMDDGWVPFDAGLGNGNCVTFYRR